MKHYFQFVLLFLIIGSNNIFSQQGDSTKVYIYEPFKSGQSIDQKTDIKINRNCLKWDWSLLARGVFALNYERSLSSKLSAIVGAGVTYRDFFYETGQDEDVFSAESGDKVTPGYYCEGNIRFYPVEGDLEGFYLSPFVRYRQYDVQSNLGTGDELFSIGYKITDFGFTIGSQQEIGYSGIMVDSYFGVAYRNRIADDVDWDYNTSTGTVTKSNTWVPAILLGFKIGLPF